MYNTSQFSFFQALILKKFPAELIIVFFYVFFAAILSTIVSLIADRDPSAWALQPNIRLFAVLYSVCQNASSHSTIFISFQFNLTLSKLPLMHYVSSVSIFGF